MPRIRDYGRGEAIMSTVLEPVRSPAAECGVLLLPRRPWEPCFPWADGPEAPVYRGGLQRRAPKYPCKSAHRADPYIPARCEAVHTFSNDASLGSARIKVGKIPFGDTIMPSKLRIAIARILVTTSGALEATKQQYEGHSETCESQGNYVGADPHPGSWGPFKWLAIIVVAGASLL